jgi:hypothetical protein
VTNVSKHYLTHPRVMAAAWGTEGADEMDSESDFWIEDQTNDVPSQWPVVDGSGAMSRVIAYCPERADAEQVMAALSASQRPEQAGEAFTENDLAILYRLIDQYTEAAYADLPRDHESHAVREALREKVTRHLIAAREALATRPARRADGAGNEPCGCGDRKISHTSETGPCIIHGCECPGYRPWSEMPDEWKREQGLIR